MGHCNPTPMLLPHLVALYCPFVIIVSCHMIQHCLQVEGNAI